MHKKRQLGIIAVIPLLLFGIFYGLKHGYISPMVKGIDIRIIGGTFITNVNKYVIKLGDTVSISPGEYIMVPDFAKKPDIKWNFTKFLVDKSGNVVARFEPTTSVEVIEQEIKKLLEK